MKCLLFVVITGVFIWPNGGVQAGILPGNFLPNPSIEDDSDQDGIPDGWLRGGNDLDGVIWDDSEPVSGERSLLLIDEGDASYTSWYTNVEIPPDTEELEFQWTWKYEFTSGNAGDEFRMTVAWRSEDVDIGFAHVVVREDEPDYVTENMLWQVPDDADALRLEFVTGGPQTETGEMWIDDISIARPGQSIQGDFNADGTVGIADIDLLSAAVLINEHETRFDLNGDQSVDTEDRRVWVEDIKRTYYGDSNLDGEFNSSDFVAVFQAGQYEDGVATNSTWATGDWNGDREFDSSDFVTAFQSGGFEQGPRAAVRTVPEPTAMMLLTFPLLAAVTRRRYDACAVANQA